MTYPAKYKKSMSKDLPELFKDGKSVTEVCNILQISRQTFYDWCKTHVEFGNAAEMGKQASESWWLNVGRAAAVGKIAGFQGSAWVFTMKNRFGWRDQPEIDMSVGDTKPVVINFVGAPVNDNYPIN